MFGSTLHEEYLNDPTQARLRGGETRSWAVLGLIIVGIGAFIAWAALFEIEEVTRGIGRVVPTQQTQVVQSPDAGVVRDIAIAEGDTVEVGQVLLVIDDTAANASRGELLQQEAALLAEQVRLKAEVALDRAPDFPAALQTRAPDAILAEIDVLASSFEQLDAELAVLEDQLTQRRADLAQLRADRAKQRAVRAPLTEEVALTEELVNSGAVPRVDFLRLKARLAELDGNLAVLDAQEPNLQASIAEARNQIRLAQSAHVATARQRLARLGVELAVIREALRAAENRVTRTQLVAPVRGTVNAVLVTSSGAVVSPGTPLVEIVPLDDSLEIEVEIAPRDVAFIRPGDPASVKITAYDYLVYGALEGEVMRIGADTIRREDGQEVFKMIVRTDRTDLGQGDLNLPIRPGMRASVDIQTGRRTVLSFLMQPLLRIKSEALREN